MSKLFDSVLRISVISITVNIFASHKQIELCPNRKAYMQQVQKSSAQPSPEVKICVFCDPEILARNKIVEKDEQSDAMVIMNLHPYFQQGFHVMVMPIEHRENPIDFFPDKLTGQVSAMLKFGTTFHDQSVMQEFVKSWGKTAGQSQPHLHIHLKAYVQESCSLYERDCFDKNITKDDEDYKFDIVKSLWKGCAKSIASDQAFSSSKTCSCCCDIASTDDAKKFIIARFNHNIVCLSNHPNLPVQVHVIPYKHVNTFKDLSLQEAHENIALAMALLGKVRSFAQESIAGGCDGVNWLTTSLGAKASAEQHTQYPHLHTIVIPRLNMPLSPGTLVGMTCKLDFNPTEFMTYMKDFKQEFQQLIHH